MDYLAAESMANALSMIHAFVSRDTLGTSAKTSVSICIYTISLYIIHLGNSFDPRCKPNTLVSCFDSTSQGEFFSLSAF